MTNVNKTIHESMGLCWHRDLIQSYGHVHRCGVCDYQLLGPKVDIIKEHNPDYTAPVHYCALMDWMRDSGRHKKLQEYCRSLACTEPVNIGEWLHCDREEQVTLIAEAIEAGVLK